MTSTMERVFLRSSSSSLEWCGMHGLAGSLHSQEADCIIALGSRFDDRTTGHINDYAPSKKK